MKKIIIIILLALSVASCTKEKAVPVTEGVTQEIVITSNRPIDIKLGHDHWRTTGKQMTYLTTVVDGVITYIELESVALIISLLYVLWILRAFHRFYKDR